MKQNLSLLSTGRKQLASRFNFAYRYIDDVLSITNPDFENYLGRMHPVELEIKTRQRANTLLLTCIYSCRSVGTFNFTLPFMKNATILISISQICHSCLAIFHLRPPMASLFRNINDMPGLATWMFYFEGDTTFL